MEVSQTRRRDDRIESRLGMSWHDLLLIFGQEEKQGEKELLLLLFRPAFGGGGERMSTALRQI